MSAAPQWTPQLVENLLVREFIKGERIDADLPPAPAAPSAAHGFYVDSSDSMRFLSKYVRLGPSAVTAVQPSQSQNQFGSASKPSTPHKTNHHGAFAPSSQQNQNPSRTPKANAAGAAPAAAPAGALPPRTPKAKEMPPPTTPNPNTPTNAARTGAHIGPPGSNVDALARKKPRFEWPRNIPTNAMLRTDKPKDVRAQRELRIVAQAGVDFDLVFRQQPGAMPMEQIFQAFPKAVAKLKAERGFSGDWRNDTFTAEEESQYKRDIGIIPRFAGPSQAARPGTYF